MSAILEELSSLRREVRRLSHLKAELEEVKAKLQAICATNAHCCGDQSAGGSAPTLESNIFYLGSDHMLCRRDAPCATPAQPSLL